MTEWKGLTQAKKQSLLLYFSVVQVCKKAANKAANIIINYLQTILNCKVFS